jgi:hypothetical protein
LKKDGLRPHFNRKCGINRILNGCGVECKSVKKYNRLADGEYPKEKRKAGEITI